jgi:hypothetical protein
MLNRNLPRTALLSGSMLAVLAFAGTSATSAFADVIESNLGVLDNLELTGIKAGRLTYKNTATGAVGDKQLGQVKSIKVDAVPAVTPALEALAAKDDKASVRKLSEAIVKARAVKQKTWLVPYLQSHLMRCHTRLGDAVTAAQVYCEMVQGKADASLFAEPIGIAAEKTLMGIVKAADENDRKAIYARVKDLRKTTPADFSAYLDALAEATGITEAAPTPTATATPTGTQPGTDAGPATPVKPTATVTARPGALLLTNRVLRTIQENSAESTDMQMAVSGRYTEAVKAMKTALSTKAEMTGPRLFVLGRVQQELAEQEKDPEKKNVLLKEAALCFIRVGALFHEEDAGYYEPSMLELARIHQAFGNPSAVEKMMADIGNYGETADEPAYVKRYAEFKASLDKK